MGMVDSPGERRGSKRSARQRKRLGFRLDMTPMVDVAFLLLTFFMLTTTFAKSNTMEINIPPETGEVDVAELNVMTLRVPGDGFAYWSLGEDAPRRTPLYDQSENFAMLSKELRQVLRQQFGNNKKLVIVVKISDKAKYKSLVDIIDEFNMMKIDRFSLDEFTAQDEAAIQKVVAMQ
ncbi:biopolymer transporter ExbD [Chlorobaculum sp. 24CR]|uniref:ExbD/TolR family protein n=1 Tax=Chlorobaculum sp. 24CR TaxID=2508878 RepID=UPI00100B8910|nr:biopolymer transporter ExbD [Chlorobaculum sp. 24CR]RXK89080.1 biopolymer transporter ExbD [Chlorobaculum sp. 24CR]